MKSPHQFSLSCCFIFQNNCATFTDAGILLCRVAFAVKKRFSEEGFP